MTLDDLDGQLDIMPGAFLYELWKYHQRVRGNLLLDLLGFRMTGARGTLKDLHCVKLSTFGIPSWLEDYLESIRNAPSCFDLTKFHISLTRHTAPTTTLSSGCSSCASIPSETIHAFWAALTAVVHNSFGRAEADLLLVESETRPQSHTMPTGQVSPPPENMNLRETDVILQSSDGANFRVHKVILATSSPFFSDMFSLAQPSEDEIVDGLPVVRLPEDAEVLHSLATMLYPIPSVIPKSYDKVLDLLAASQKYDMVAVQSSIRTEVSQRTFLTLIGTGAFRAYAIASRKRLTPEMEKAAHLTLDHPMTFEYIGEEISLFDGWALRDLARFRRRCRDRVVSCLETFLHCRDGPSKIWDRCCQPKEPLPVVLSLGRNPDNLAGWLHDFISRNVGELRSSFTRPLLEQSSFRKQFLAALQTHIKIQAASSAQDSTSWKGSYTWDNYRIN
ncbi:hypothetical protein BJV78DRAFT_160489 [Lactifluus subvellereus]|nr:hypothetical protein BJV78DRAFT_160489 [Lactifluus subvellereus]